MGEWIKLSERAPDAPHKTEFLIFFEDTGRMVIDEWIEDATEGWCFWYGDPSHWMPLPAPPKYER